MEMSRTSSNSTSLSERIRQRAEQEIQRKILDLLYDRLVDYHARRGIRHWCGCTFCLAKRRGTAEISYGVKFFSHGELIPGYILQCHCTDGCPGGCLAKRPNPWKITHDHLPPCENIDDAIRNRMERIRENLRMKLRRTLYKLKEGK